MLLLKMTNHKKSLSIFITAETKLLIKQIVLMQMLRRRILLKSMLKREFLK